LDIRGKMALITGAASGIGFAIAQALAGEGSRVILADIDRDELARAGEAIPGAETIVLDVTDRDQWALAAEQFGAIDILVNNAGVYEFAPLDGITSEHFHKQFDLNVLGLLLVSQEAARHFNEAGGSIINISSGVSTIAPPNSAVYTATKASVDAISSVLSKELAPRKIRVNTVNPGMIATEGVVSAGFAEGDMRKWIESVTPMGRIGKVEEIAAAVAFFASNDASYVTGETLHVTGGLH